MTPPERDGVMQAATNGAGSWQSRLFDEKVKDDCLYRALDKLLPHKEALGKHLDLIFASGANPAAAHFHLQGQGCHEWQELLDRARVG